MTIIVSGDNQLAKENLAATIQASLSDVPLCVESLTQLWGVPAGDITVVLMDHSMVCPESLGTVRSIFPSSVKVAVYGAPANADDAMSWLSQGYDGYLPRSMTAPAIVCAIQLMMRGERFVPSVAINAGAETVPVGGGDQNLSPRQLEVLTMVATGASNKHIARALNVEEVTVKSHVKAIFRKLGVRSRTEAARHVLSPAARQRGHAGGFNATPVMPLPHRPSLPIG